MALNGLKTLSKNLSELDLEREQLLLIEQNKDKLVLAQAEVLSEGKDKTGMNRTDNYKPYTIDSKSGLPGLAGVVNRVTFYMTGLLYSSLYAKISTKTFIVEAESKGYADGGTTLDTFAKMIKRIGSERYGIDPQRINEFRNSYVINPLRKILFDKTGLGIK